MPAITVTPMSPRPNTSAISGVIATSGTDRNTIATGMNVCSTVRRRLNTIAHPSAAAVPTTSPTDASRKVVIDAWYSCVRAGPPVVPLVTNRQTSSGPFPMKWLMWNVVRKSCHAPSTTTSDTVHCKRRPPTPPPPAHAVGVPRTTATGAIAAVGSSNAVIAGPLRCPRREQPADEGRQPVGDPGQQRRDERDAPRPLDLSACSELIIATPRPGVRAEILADDRTENRGRRRDARARRTGSAARPASGPS